MKFFNEVCCRQFAFLKKRLRAVLYLKRFNPIYEKIVNIRVDDNKMVGISFEYDTELIMKVKTIRNRKYIPEKYN